MSMSINSKLRVLRKRRDYLRTTFDIEWQPWDNDTKLLHQREWHNRVEASALDWAIEKLEELYPPGDAEKRRQENGAEPRAP